ncbi:pyocin knob domain-containing protein [Thermus hydrothermalis]|uniref:pyocin knob domain-containing protein n=1 Tax=Thermus hydrothermalis TaxID=2908148 RepID=UPI001FAAD5EC|nr:pyocin knob domain-containing protein [Thermus hydrothermalis]
MPKNLTPQDQWETDFQVPIPGEPRNIGPLELLFQRLLNRTERLKGRIAEILGLPWDAAPPDTLSGLHSRVQTLETAQGGTTLSAHRTAPVLDHPDGSVTAAKLASGAAAANMQGPDLQWGAISWDTVTNPGWYRVTSGGSGGGGTPPPANEQDGFLIVARSGNSVIQMFIPAGASDPLSYVRKRSNTSWAAWRIQGTDFRYAALGATAGFSGQSSVNLLSLSLPAGIWLIIGWTTLSHITSGDVSIHYQRARLNLIFSGGVQYLNTRGIWATAQPTTYADIRPDAHVWAISTGGSVVTLNLSDIPLTGTTYVSGKTFLFAMRLA